MFVSLSYIRAGGRGEEIYIWKFYILPIGIFKTEGTKLTIIFKFLPPFPNDRFSFISVEEIKIQLIFKRAITIFTWNKKNW